MGLDGTFVVHNYNAPASDSVGSISNTEDLYSFYSHDVVCRIRQCHHFWIPVVLIRNGSNLDCSTTYKSVITGMARTRSTSFNK